MKDSVQLTIATLLSVLFFVCHLAGDIVRGIEKGTLYNLPALPIAVLWLCGALVLAEKRSGYVITLLLSILGVGITAIHLSGKGVGVGSAIARSDGAFFFVFTLFALGVTSLYSIVLAARGLWGLRRARDERRPA